MRPGGAGRRAGPRRDAPDGGAAEPSTAFGGARNPGRVVAFSDAVFAIAVTLLVLGIQPPEDFRRLFPALAALWPSYLAYAVTFLMIGQIWANHHVMFDHIRVVDRLLMFLNTLLLMDIAFLPFAASVLSDAFHSGDGEHSAVVFYGATIEVAAILFNIIWGYARRGRRLLGATIDDTGARYVARRFRVALLWIGTGTVVGAFVPLLGVVVIAAFIPAYWMPIRGEHTLRDAGPAPGGSPQEVE